MKRKLHIEIDLETGEFQSIDMLKNVVKVAIERVFFVDVKINNITVDEMTENDN